MASILASVEIRITDLKCFSDLLSTLVENIDKLPPQVVDAIYLLQEELSKPNGQE